MQQQPSQSEQGQYAHTGAPTEFDQMLAKPSKFERFQGEPEDKMFESAQRIAEALQKKLLIKGDLFTEIGGKKHIHFEAWCALGALVGVGVRTDAVSPETDETGQVVAYRATVTAIDQGTGAALGTRSSRCDSDEVVGSFHRWRDKGGKPNKHAMAAMAQTRAGSRAFSTVLGWIPVMAGFSSTSAEEMDGVVARSEPQPTAPHPALNPNSNPVHKLTEADKSSLYKLGFDRAKAMGLTSKYDKFKPLNHAIAVVAGDNMKIDDLTSAQFVQVCEEIAKFGSGQ